MWNFETVWVMGEAYPEVLETSELGTVYMEDIDISNIITHRLDITEYEKGFEAMNRGKCGKVILDWTKLD